MQAVKTKENSKLVTAIVRGAVTLAVLSALMIAAMPAQAQTQEVLYPFAGGTSDGANPYGGITFHNSNIYGTTYDGGLYGFGTVYQLTPNGTGGWAEQVLYSFCPASPSCTDGENPTFGSVVFDSKGNLYGTTFGGGANGFGTIFQLVPPVTGSTWTYNVLYSFGAVPDAQNPVNGLIMDKSGDLFGTAFGGGPGANGAVFELSPVAGGTWKESVPTSINSLYAGLVQNPTTGIIYGTTSTTVFELGKNPSGNWVELPIFTFATAAQGSQPNGTLMIDASGNLYGTTTAGGTNSDGVVYKLTLGTGGKWTEKVIYNFGANGIKPYGGVVADSQGNLYGTTTAGGKNGAGIVYELIYNATNKTYAERSIQAFVGENGALPYSGLVVDANNLVYGTTYLGGANGDGAVYVANGHAQVTTTTCVSSQNPSVLGQAVTFTATVTPAPPDGEPIVFEPVGQSNMVGGVATFTVSNLKVGSTTITAVYDGDLGFITSKSVSFKQVVTKQ